MDLEAEEKIEEVQPKQTLTITSKSLHNKHPLPSDYPLPLRLGFHQNQWQSAPPMVQRIITKGLTWRWSVKPPPLSFPPLSTCRGNLAPHINDMLNAGVINSIKPQKCFTSRLFLVPKSSGGDRVVIDLSQLNKFIASPTFKMSTVDRIRHSIPIRATFTSIDLTSAFHHIPIHLRFQKYLAFSYQGNLYSFQAMPFGLNLGPRIFTMVANFALGQIHASEIHAAVYIDDWFLWNHSAQQLALDTQIALSVLRQLGFTINMEKSQLQPLSHIIFLGVLWSGDTHSLLPSPDNRFKVISLVRSILTKQRISLKTYQKVLEAINFIAPYISTGLRHFRQIVYGSPKFSGALSSPCNAAFRTRLEWWTDSKNLSVPVSISTPPPNITLWTDASSSGWGGITSTGLQINRTWSSTDLPLHINIKELKAVTYSLLHFLPPPYSSIMVRTDNTTVVAVINKQGSNKSSRLNLALEELLPLCLQHNWTLRAKHLPGHLNTWADSLSRNHPIKSEWSLTQESFDRITHNHSLQIDLFAHPGNAKLPSYGCLFPYPKATVIDSLTTNWDTWQKIYLFPPTNLIPACLKKLQSFKGKGVFIAPRLTSAPWWTAFVGRCNALEAIPDVYQTVQGNTVWAHEVTSLAFRAYSF